MRHWTTLENWPTNYNLCVLQRKIQFIQLTTADLHPLTHIPVKTSTLLLFHRDNGQKSVELTYFLETKLVHANPGVNGLTNPKAKLPSQIVLHVPILQRLRETAAACSKRGQLQARDPIGRS